MNATHTRLNLRAIRYSFAIVLTSLSLQSCGGGQVTPVARAEAIATVSYTVASVAAGVDPHVTWNEAAPAGSSGDYTAVLTVESQALGNRSSDEFQYTPIKGIPTGPYTLSVSNADGGKSGANLKMDLQRTSGSVELRSSTESSTPRPLEYEMQGWGVTEWQQTFTLAPYTSITFKVGLTLTASLEGDGALSDPSVFGFSAPTFTVLATKGANPNTGQFLSGDSSKLGASINTKNNQSLIGQLHVKHDALTGTLTNDTGSPMVGSFSIRVQGEAGIGKP